MPLASPFSILTTKPYACGLGWIVQLSHDLRSRRRWWSVEEVFKPLTCCGGFKNILAAAYDAMTIHE